MDTPAPLSLYAQSKLRGEQFVAQHGGEWYVLRTAVIFGPKGESDLILGFHFADLLDNLVTSPDPFIHAGSNVMEVLRRATPNG